jgi:hypothetical protein
MVEGGGDAFHLDDRKSQTVHIIGNTKIAWRRRSNMKSHEGDAQTWKRMKAMLKYEIAWRRRPQMKLHEGDTQKWKCTKAMPKHQIAWESHRV